MTGLSMKTTFGVLFVLALLGCAKLAGGLTQPDLIPERRAGGQGDEGFCNRDQAGDLIVIVRNQTNNPVLVPTLTEVAFSNSIISEITPPLAGGASYSFSVPIPAGCFSSDCSFEITVDREDVVEESHVATPDNHEENNRQSGICIG
ncbi:MAG: hypothetical protein V3V13_05595 [Paracoccaceae bacterium]